MPSKIPAINHRRRLRSSLLRRGVRVTACRGLASAIVFDSAPRKSVPATKTTLMLSLPLASFAALLLSEPAGLAIGKVTLRDGSQVLGVLAEPWLVENQKDITAHGSWRAYTGHSYSA